VTTVEPPPATTTAPAPVPTEPTTAPAVTLAP
jgi:hypothetical protein